MNSTAKGDQFEDEVFHLLDSMIRDGDFPLIYHACRFFKKKGYYSSARMADITFDIVIEVWMDGAEECSMRLIIECKNLARQVSVDDIEEFYQKVDQIGSANAKLIVVSRSGYQKGAITFAGSKNVGLIRLLGPESVEWILRRPGLQLRDEWPDSRRAVAALTDQLHTSELGHLVLGHSRYVVAEHCLDFDVAIRDRVRRSDLARLDCQANFFASSLLLPEAEFRALFDHLAREHELVDRGHGRLYVDNTPWNRKLYALVTRDIMSWFGVSRFAATLRLIRLNLMTDDRMRGIRRASDADILESAVRLLLGS